MKSVSRRILSFVTALCLVLALMLPGWPPQANMCMKTFRLFCPVSP